MAVVFDAGQELRGHFAHLAATGLSRVGSPTART